MLDSSTLADALEAVFLAQKPLTSEIAADFAHAYKEYASLGQFGASFPIFTSAHEDAFAATMLASIADPLLGLPILFANAWVTAVTTIWLAVPVVGPEIGLTVGCPGASSLTGIAAVVIPGSTEKMTATSIAALIHSATLTVTAAIVTPVPRTASIS